MILKQEIKKCKLVPISVCSHSDAAFFLSLSLSLIYASLMPHVYKYGVLLINVSFMLTDAKIPDLEKAENIFL